MLRRLQNFKYEDTLNEILCQERAMNMYMESGRFYECSSGQP